VGGRPTRPAATRTLQRTLPPCTADAFQRDRRAGLYSI
jgi:hypothetical protein